jgi:choline-sulfatase
MSLALRNGHARPSVGFLILIVASLAVWHGSRSLQRVESRGGVPLGRLPADMDPSRLNLLIITLDTTRADHLGVYGADDVQTPNIDRLAREGVLFEQASSVAPLTLPAHCSLFTGLFPPRHGVRDNGGYALQPAQVTLAEMLQARGFRTGAFVASYVLDARSGLNKGFDRYVGVPHPSQNSGGRALRRPANEVADLALAWLREVDSRRFFGWLHFYDAHAPYDPPEPFRSRYRDPYAGAISFVDSQIGRVLAFLEERHLLDKTVIAIIGDHGEGLGEHGERTHKLFVYESVLHVPFIVRAPSDRMPARRVDAVTRSVDLMPTMLDLVGVSAPPGTDGTSLVPLMTGAVTDLSLDAYAEATYPLLHFGWSDLRAVRAGNFKLIEAPRPELYDLAADPHERRNLYEDQPALAERLATRLRSLERRFASASRADGHASPVDRETLDRLASLGYVGSAARVGAGDRRSLADPKDKLDLFNKIVGEAEFSAPVPKETPSTVSNGYHAEKGGLP